MMKPAAGLCISYARVLKISLHGEKECHDDRSQDDARPPGTWRRTRSATQHYHSHLCAAKKPGPGTCKSKGGTIEDRIVGCGTSQRVPHHLEERAEDERRGVQRRQLHR